jgi:PAS domain-containing protein
LSTAAFATRKSPTKLPTVGGNRELASWLISRRQEIEQVMCLSLGPAAPAPADPETEALRRFRSFAASALLRGELSTPALDGLRTNERRVLALLQAWSEAAERVAGARGREVRSALDPLVNHFRVSLRTTGASRRASGAPSSRRRAVSAAIDRVADAFLAIDTDTGRIADANPAAGALLEVARDALLGVDAMSFVPEPSRRHWWDQLDAVAESEEPRCFSAPLVDTRGGALEIEATVTRFNTRGRTLALVLARPVQK